MTMNMFCNRISLYVVQASKQARSVCQCTLLLTTADQKLIRGHVTQIYLSSVQSTTISEQAGNQKLFVMRFSPTQRTRTHKIHEVVKSLSIDNPQADSKLPCTVPRHIVGYFAIKSRPVKFECFRPRLLNCIQRTLVHSKPLSHENSVDPVFKGMHACDRAQDPEQFEVWLSRLQLWMVIPELRNQLVSRPRHGLVFWQPRRC